MSAAPAPDYNAVPAFEKLEESYHLKYLDEPTAIICSAVAITGLLGSLLAMYLCGTDHPIGCEVAMIGSVAFTAGAVCAIAALVVLTYKRVQMSEQGLELITKDDYALLRNNSDQRSELLRYMDPQSIRGLLLKDIEDQALIQDLADYPELIIPNLMYLNPQLANKLNQANGDWIQELILPIAREIDEKDHQYPREMYIDMATHFGHVHPQIKRLSSFLIAKSPEDQEIEDAVGRDDVKIKDNLRIFGICPYDLVVMDPEDLESWNRMNLIQPFEFKAPLSAADPASQDTGFRLPRYKDETCTEMDA